jgi:hypothetical protein
VQWNHSDLAGCAPRVGLPGNLIKIVASTRFLTYETTLN